jgi:hypothetical protein
MHAIKLSLQGRAAITRRALRSGAGDNAQLTVPTDPAHMVAGQFH